MVEALPELIGMELLELVDGQAIELRILRWEAGRATIHPGYGDRPKLIRVLRVWVPPADKPVGPDYWDITSQTLMYQMQPYLERVGFQTRIYRITKHGVAPRARFTLEVR